VRRQACAVVVVLGACGGDGIRRDAGASDAPLLADAATRDAGPDAALPGPADAAQMVRVTGNVQFDGPVSGATVSIIDPAVPARSTTTGANGDFFFDVPLGARLVFKVEGTGFRPMIRGYHALDAGRFRTFYMLGPEEEAGITALHALDPAKGILEVDFRNAQIGGYGVTLAAEGGGAVTPGFGVALDGDGKPVLSTTTVVGGDGSTLLLGDVPVGKVDFTPLVPGAATKTCRPCDGPPLPIQAGVVTWFDFECGDASCEG